MKTLKIHKAQRTLKNKEVESMSIVIDEEVPNYRTLEDAGTRYRADAAYLSDALSNSLPGGTFDQLLIFMLQTKASHFKISYKGETTNVEIP